MTTKPFRVITHAPYLLVAPPLPRATRGLGDVVASVANPIAVLVDKVTGSRLVGCPPCGKRRDVLNELVPNILKPFDR